MRKILLNCEENLAPFMEALCDSGPGSFQKGRGFAMVDEDESGLTMEILAGVWFEGFNGKNVNMHVAAVPGKRWMTRTYLWLVFHYAFEQLGAARITGLVDESNLAARRFDEHIGFTLEARLRNASHGGDLLVYVMHREDCRWLGLRRDKSKDH